MRVHHQLSQEPPEPDAGSGSGAAGAAGSSCDSGGRVRGPAGGGGGRVADDGTIAVAQLHGHEDDAYIAALRALAPGKALWKAFKVRSEADLAAAAASTADQILLDNGYGTGQAFDWSLAGGVRRPFLLAGGLTPENIPDAAARLHPMGLDISSGVETGRQKDRAKILAAVAAARKE